MLGHRGALGVDRLQKLAPRLNKGFGALGLQPFGKRANIDQGAFSAISQQHGGRRTMVGRLPQRPLWRRIHGVRCSEAVDIENVGRARVHGLRACEQQPLRPCAEIGKPLPTSLPS
jgi:hypothetical protein